MRDKKRISRILSLIEILWNRNPDQRFYQLLINEGLITDDPQMWRIEDDIIEQYLNTCVKVKKDGMD